MDFVRRARALFVAFNNEIEEHRVELAQLYPHEACIMSCRTLAIFGLPTFSFAVHNAYLVATHDVRKNSLLAAASLIRVILALPRPYLWWRMHELFKQVGACVEIWTLMLCSQSIRRHASSRRAEQSLSLTSKRPSTRFLRCPLLRAALRLLGFGDR